MAEYVFNSYYGYARDGGSENASQTSATDEAGVLTDEDGNSTFDPGETLYVDGSPVGTFYAGYFPGDPPDINNFYIVVEVDDDNFIIYGYPGTADSDLPNTFHEIDDVDPEVCGGVEGVAGVDVEEIKLCEQFEREGPPFLPVHQP